MMGETSQADKLPLSYLILYKGGSAELTEKKSRFIATTYPVESEEEALAFVEEMRKKYWDARHNCWAYVIGERGEKKRCSDDGEPSQTAGKPMLDVLTGSDSNQSLCGCDQVFRRCAFGDRRTCKGLFRGSKRRPEKKCDCRKKAGKKDSGGHRL